MTAPHAITELWAWVTVEPDGSDGIIATNAIMPGYFTPMVTSQGATAKAMEEIAQAVCRLAGRPPPRLIHFVSTETRH